MTDIGCIDCKWYIQKVDLTKHRMMDEITDTITMWSVFRCCVYPTKCRKLDEVHALERPPWCPIRGDDT